MAAQTSLTTLALILQIAVLQLILLPVQVDLLLEHAAFQARVHGLSLEVEGQLLVQDPRLALVVNFLNDFRGLVVHCVKSSLPGVGAIKDRVLQNLRHVFILENVLLVAALRAIDALP